MFAGRVSRVDGCQEDVLPRAVRRSGIPGLISRLIFCERGGDIYTGNDGFISTVALWADETSKGEFGQFMRDLVTDMVRDDRLRLLHQFKPAQYTSLANRGTATNQSSLNTSAMHLSISTTS